AAGGQRRVAAAGHRGGQGDRRPQAPGDDRAPGGARMTSVLRRLTWDKIVPLLLVLTLLVGTQLEPRFGRGGNLVFVVQDIGEIMIIAFAMTLVIMTGEIDLSVASTAALASCVLGWAFAHG